MTVGAGLQEGRQRRGRGRPSWRSDLDPARPGRGKTGTGRPSRPARSAPGPDWFRCSAGDDDACRASSWSCARLMAVLALVLLRQVRHRRRRSRRGRRSRQTTDHASTATTTELPPAPTSSRRPNSGVAPTDAGDRGGGLQTLVFVLVSAARPHRLPGVAREPARRGPLGASDLRLLSGDVSPGICRQAVEAVEEADAERRGAFEGADPSPSPPKARNAMMISSRSPGDSTSCWSGIWPRNSGGGVDAGEAVGVQRQGRRRVEQAELGLRRDGVEPGDSPPNAKSPISSRAGTSSTAVDVDGVVGAAVEGRQLELVAGRSARRRTRTVSAVGSNGVERHRPASHDRPCRRTGRRRTTRDRRASGSMSWSMGRLPALDAVVRGCRRGWRPPVGGSAS